MTEKKRLFLVDGNSFLYRAYFATPYLATSRGLPTNATYAMTNMILKLLKEKKPDFLLVIFDSKVPSFRHAISREYKAQRKPMPQSLSVQIPYVKSIIEALGIPIIEIEGYEADDIIGTIVEKMRNEPLEIYIVTGDKDLMQVVRNNVYIYDTMRNMIYGEREVFERFGVGPSQICDFLALAGDSIDNIPGVPGIGKKTAQILIEKFGTIEKIYERIEEIDKDSIREKLLKGKEAAFLSKELATIRRDVEIGELDLNAKKEPDLKKLKSLFRELEFSSLYKEIQIEEHVELRWDEIEVEKIGLEKVSVFANFQTGPGQFPKLSSFAIYDGQKVSYSEKREEMERILNGAKELVLHNSKDFLLAGFDLDLNKTFDVMLSSYLLNPLKKDLTPSAVISEYLEIDIKGESGKAQYFEIAKALHKLKEVLTLKMEELDLKSLYYNVEMPLVEVISEMEKTGIKLDPVKLMDFSRELGDRIERLTKSIYELSGVEFNLNSPQQLSKVLFHILKLRPVKRTKKGYSTDMEVLEELIDEHPIVRLLLEYRTLSKLKSTYIDTLPGWINPKTKRIHASFNQMNVATGRLSTSNPNLQNIPIRGEEGKKIREAFIAEEGFLLMSSDYSQIELRILAHLSKDEALLDAFMRGEDIHNEVAAQFFGVKKEEITPDMRRVAKVVNFGIIYGISAYGLAKELGISQGEAQRYIDEYFKVHKGVKEYMERVVKDAEEKGYVKTLYGRIRYIPELFSPDPKVRQLGIREAMNTPIQGTAADIIKLAMVNIHRRKKSLGLSSRLVLQIHDELLFEVKEEEKEIMEELVKEEMEKVVNLIVPLKVSLGFGKNWAEAKS